jgi:hypothetical protein
MTVCVVNSSLGSEWFYPVVDPYRTVGAGPYHYGYVFAWDGVDVTVTRNFSLSRCRMKVEISSSLPGNPKLILGFNFSINSWHDSLRSTDAVKEMTISKWKPGQQCSDGTDTLVLGAETDLGDPKLLYAFPTVDFWDFWGGCTVNFTWVGDTNYWGRPWAPSGALTPLPKYPAVGLPDGTLMRNAAGTGVSVVFGGTDFPVGDSRYLGVTAIETTAATTRAVLEPDRRSLLGGSGPGPAPIPRDLLAGAIPNRQLPPIPADFSLVREWNRPEVYVVFGGAKFRIPDPPTLFSLGYDWSMVRVIPEGGASKLLTIPIDRTLIQEQHDSKVFHVENQALRLVKTPAVMEARCLPWRHVRVVPDGSLSALPKGPDLDLP